MNVSLISSISGASFAVLQFLEKKQRKYELLALNIGLFQKVGELRRNEVD